MEKFKDHLETDTKELFSYDFSSILTKKKFGISSTDTYTGVFGQKNRRIDFHLTFRKENKDTYSVTGKNKLGNNIRNLSGEIRLLECITLNFPNEHYPIHIIIYTYRLNEPRDRDGTGYFTGVGSITFSIKHNQPKIYWAASGDLREYNNMFVGVWNRYNSHVSRECIFTFFPSGLHNKLPYRNNFYTKYEGYKYNNPNTISDEFKQYGWKSYKNNKANEVKWWKD